MILTRTLLLVLLIFTQSSFCGSFEDEFVSAAINRTKQNILYDGSYFSIAYPNGDVPQNIGVCTDVIVRSYRALGTDLQVLVHEDMSKNFSVYPSNRIWGLTSTDRNIDHRRVPNLRVFFARQGDSLPITNRATDYVPGDLVTWMLPGNLPHIGIVSNRVSRQTSNPLIVHNIGSGPSLEDMLFTYKITGHYRFVPAKYNQLSERPSGNSAPY